MSLDGRKPKKTTGFYNIRKEILRFKPDAPTTSLAAMARDLGVELTEAPQVGVATCVNIATVLAHLLANGHVLGAPETIASFEESAGAASGGGA